MAVRKNLIPVLVFAATFVIVLSSALYLMNRHGNDENGDRTVKTYSDIPRNENPVGDAADLFSHETYIANDPGGTRPLIYFWHTPNSAVKDTPLPLVLVLHGTPGNAYASRYLVLRDYRTKYPAYILAPVLPRDDTWAVPSGWPDEGKRERLPDVMALIANLTQNFNIDKNRIYVIGCSEGGFGAFGAALRYPDIFAAAVPISGGWDKADASGLTRIPLRVTHGGQDKNVPTELSRDVSHAIEKAGGNILYTEIPDMAHQCPSSDLYDESLWSWLFAQHR